jgi:transposase InsO family protein
VKFAFVKANRSRVWPAGAICRVLGVTRQGFYQWLGRKPCKRRQRREQLAVAVRRVHAQSRRTYGSPRVYEQLVAEGEQVCVNTVARVMAEQGIRVTPKAKFVPRTTDSSHGSPVARNRLNRQFEAEAPNCKWVTDITYVPTGEGWLYVAAVMDLYSRKIVGHATADHMKVGLVAEALAMAVTHRQPAAGLLHHSDRGVQYASDAYQGLLAENRMVCSMSGRGDCWDNAAMESFWSTFKCELTHREDYPTRQAAQQAIFEYIECWYNRSRLHSSLGYQSPETFEASRN